MMTFEMRFVVVALGAFAASGMVGALAAWLCASRRRPAPLADSTLLFLRLVPSLAATTGISYAPGTRTTRTFAPAWVRQRLAAASIPSTYRAL